MKKLLLLSALLIFACSSDDSSDDNNSNQNFLKKYDGVTWSSTEYNPSGAADYWITFSPNGFNECEFYGYYSGGAVIWGEIIDGNYSHTVIENSPERLVTETVETDDFGETFTYTTTHEATNNGNGLEVTYSDDLGYIEYYDRVSSNPCN